MKKLFILILLLFFAKSVNAFDFYCDFHQPSYLNITVEDIEKPYSVQLSYEGVNYHTVFTDLHADSFTFDRLANGITYYIKVIDVNGDFYIKRYTTPYTIINAEQLKIVDIKDNSATVEWSYLNSYYDINVHLNGSVINVCDTEITSYTLSDLMPNTEYRVHITTKTGYSSNIVTFKTTNFENRLFARLDDLLSSLFVPNNTTDSNFNGIPDTYDPIYEAWKKWQDYSPVSGGTNIADMIGDLSGGFNGSDEYPNFEVSFGPGLTFEVFAWDEFYAEIQMIRKLLEAVIWITFFMFLVKLLIPMFKV